MDQQRTFGPLSTNPTKGQSLSSYRVSGTPGSISPLAPGCSLETVRQIFFLVLICLVLAREEPATLIKGATDHRHPGIVSENVTRLIFGCLRGSPE